MFLHFRLFAEFFLMPVLAKSFWVLIPVWWLHWLCLSTLWTMASIIYLHVLDMREAFHCIVVNPLPTLWVTVFFKKLLSPVFRSISIKAVQKLFVFFNHVSPSPRVAECVVVARYWCLLWTPSSSIPVYNTQRGFIPFGWAQCTRRHPPISAVTPWD